MTSPLGRNWAVFISGRGSNLQAILDTQPLVRVRVVVSSNPRAGGVLRARRQGIPVVILPNPIDWNDLQRRLKVFAIDSIFLAGFMRLVPADFIAQWPGRILNVHPSNLPHYPGLKAFERAVAEGAPLGVTVHQVTPEVDAGEAVLQKIYEPGGPHEKKAGLNYRLSRTEQRLVREAVTRWR